MLLIDARWIFGESHKLVATLSLTLLDFIMPSIMLPKCVNRVEKMKSFGENIIVFPTARHCEGFRVATGLLVHFTGIAPQAITIGSYKRL